MTSNVTRKRMPKRTLAETRELMLHAAVDMICERAQESGDDVVAAALSHVRLTQVAQRATTLVRARTGNLDAAAITTGALYQVWPSQADFQADLLFHIADRQSTLVPGLAESILRFEASAANSLPLEDVLCRTMEEVHRHYREDPLYRVELGFLISVCDPRVRAAVAHRQLAFRATADQAWQGLLDAYGLRLRPPFRIRDLTNAVAAQIGGSIIVWFADPDSLDDPAGQDGWSLASRAILAIFTQFTEPVE
ncbi:MAG TPA: hypothetical protein VLL08_16465 [Kineosporiaceae bacterium]|nr:hypothetical protein [Kineosporiaceae bacterium]